MKAKTIITILLLAAMVLSSQISIFAKAENAGPDDNDNIIYLRIGNKTLTATLEDNSAAKALKELLAKNSITVNASDYGGFEKVGGLGTSLPTSNENITTQSGDLILYQGNQLVIFYGSNTWSYTRLGKINDVTQSELKKILGSGNVSITLSLNSFGEVPKTGVPNLTITTIVMVVLVIISAGLWGNIVRRKLKHG